MKKKTVIFDLDGTLADIEPRRLISMKTNGKLNFEIFFDPKNIVLDIPNHPVIETFKALEEAGYRMLIFSGRSEATRAVTIEWLSEYGIHPDKMIMRPTEPKELAYMQDDLLKKMWFEEEFPTEEDKENILCVYDDRDKVVKMWRDNYITCFQCDYGNF